MVGTKPAVEGKGKRCGEGCGVVCVCGGGGEGKGREGGGGREERSATNTEMTTIWKVAGVAKAHAHALPW